MDSEQKLTRARAGLVLSAPFYATLALTLKMERRDNVETMATDGAHIYWADQFVQECSDAELRGVIAHEVMHVANLHHTRRNGRDAQEWNIACDYAINPLLIAEGFTLPAGGLNDPQWHGKSAEQIFAARRQQAQNAPQGGAGQPGAGQPGQGGKAPAGGVLDAAPASDPAAMQAAELDAMARTLQAVQAAKAAGKGSAAGQLAADAIKAPAIDWRAVLRRFVDASARVEYQWHRPNRRHVAAGLYLPGKVPDGMAALAIIIDVSGSIDKAALGLFLSEVQGAVDDAAPEHIDVVQCDTQITARDTFGAGDRIAVTLTGGGGTDMQPAIDACRDASAVLVFTDCDFPRQGVIDRGAPTLWVRWGGGGDVPSWGELVDLPPAA